MTVSFEVSIALFLVSALVIGWGGTRLAGLADALADDTGLGEALFGAIFLGAVTSLSGSVTSIVAAAEGYPQLAAGNALGGIAAQTAFLAVADLAYRRANLEHAAASAANIVQACLLVVLLGTVLVAIAGPEGVGPVHLATPVIVVSYLYGMRLLSRTNRWPMWQPRSTEETVIDTPAAARRPWRRTSGSWLRFAGLLVLVGGAGWLLTESAIVISDGTGLSETMVGVLFTAVSTSLPELATSVAAVRRGALTLAVSNVIGGNVFDTLMFPMSDLAFRDGSIYHALSEDHVFWLALDILLTAILLMGLLQRERHGIANIGLESFLILVLYLGGAGILLMGG